MIFDDFKLNIYNLHQEWKRLPHVSFSYVEQLSWANAEAKDAKRLMDLALSDAMNAVMDNPQEYDLTRSQLNSSTFVRNKALADPAYQDAYKKWIDAEQKADRLEGAGYSMLHLREALKNVTKLYLAGYYSADTIIPDGVVEAVDRKEFEAEQKRILKSNPRLIRRHNDDITNEEP
jgi:hypothetical protein